MSLSGPLRVLLIEDNPADADLVQEYLDEVAATSPPVVALIRVGRLGAAYAPLRAGGIDAVLLDLSLPDSIGLETFRRVQAHAPGVPVVVLSGLSDEELAAQAVREGAQDYLVKGQIDGNLLLRALRYAVERKRAEDERVRLLALEEQARARAEAAEAMLKTRDEFLSVAAHELKTPLTSLKIVAQLMLRRMRGGGSTDPERLHEAFTTIDQQVSRLGMLVGQLLEMVRLQAGRLVLERTRTDVAALARGIVARERTWHTSHVVELSASGPMWAMVDPLRLEQVIVNLLDNAIKYSPGGGAVELAITQPASGLIELAVRDHGIGIPPEHRSHIFEQFYRAHSSDHRSGMGLGLFICREIVELHEGHIAAEFPTDGGTRFVVTLPTRLGRSTAE